MSNAKLWAVLTLLLVLMGLPSTALTQSAKLTAQDDAEIRQLYARYAYAIDTGDAETWADTFTPDGVFGNSKGRAALVEFAKTFYQRNQGHSRHWNDQLVITPTADGVTAHCYLLLWNTGTRPATLTVAAIYRDTLVRTPNGWRFRSRAVEVDQQAEASR